VVTSHIPLDLSRILYRAADAVLANSRHEPFGLVGLETMAAGGIAFTGSTGEDYVIPLVNAVVLETAEAREIEDYVLYLRAHPQESDRIRRAARRTARLYIWEAAVRNLLGKLEHQARLQGIPDEMPHRVGHHSPPALQQNIAEAEQSRLPKTRMERSPGLPQAEKAKLAHVGVGVT
jgi:Glycosyl transferases group 1